MATTLRTSFDIFYDKFNLLLSVFENDEYIQTEISRLHESKRQEFEELIVTALNIVDEVKECQRNGEFFLDETLITELKDLIDKIIVLNPHFLKSFNSYSSLFYTILEKLSELDCLWQTRNVGNGS